jgi:hypothetical protein
MNQALVVILVVHDEVPALAGITESWADADEAAVTSDDLLGLVDGGSHVLGDDEQDSLWGVAARVVVPARTCGRAGCDLRS